MYEIIHIRTIIITTKTYGFWNLRSQTFGQKDKTLRATRMLHSLFGKFSQ
jgi:hypothetical protein